MQRVRLWIALALLALTTTASDGSLTILPGTPYETSLTGVVASCNFQASGMTCTPPTGDFDLPEFQGVLGFTGSLEFGKSTLDASIQSSGVAYPANGSMGAARSGALPITPI